MANLIRKYGMFYLTHAVTFFFLCAYSLAANAPNYPFLPALFLPIYLSAAVAMSEREAGDPLLGILPLTPREIMKVKFILGFVFVVVCWFNMGAFTVLQNLSPQLTVQVMKLNTLSSIFTLLLAAAFQLGIQFFGWPNFHKLIIFCAVMFGLFGIIFFISLAKSGHNHPSEFPLIPVLDSLPVLVVGALAVVGILIFNFALRRGSWDAV